MNAEEKVPEKKLISIVTPCFNEELVLPKTLEAFLEFTLLRPDLDFELIFIDDGSIDSTYDVLRKFQKNDSRIRVVSFTRNFGHQPAVLAGLAFSKGDAVVVIDADLQDPPEVIGRMINAWESGFQIAYGKRIKRQGETGFKKTTANLFYRVLNYFSDVEIPRNVGDFQLLDRAVVVQLLAMPEKSKFLRGLISWTGFRATPIEYVRLERAAGTTKYTLAKMLKFATGAILSFSVKPLYSVLYAGFGLAVIASLFAAYFFIARISGSDALPGWTALIVAMLFLGAFQIIALGVVGIYVGRIFTEAQARPAYITKDLPPPEVQGE